MKSLAFGTFVIACATGLLAQTPVDPRVELARPIAIEDQEGDLAKAEPAWRDALAGKLSPAAHALACRRLGELLQRLGRADEAKQWLARANDAKGSVVALDDVTAGAPQDVAREAELRAKARALVAAAKELFLEAQAAQQLLWIGTTAVPEIIAGLQQTPTPVGADSLVQLLWRIGGAEADAFLVGRIADPQWAQRIASTAGAQDPVDCARAPMQALLHHPEWRVVGTCLSVTHQDAQGRSQRVLAWVESGDLLAVAQRLGPDARMYLLPALSDRKLGPDVLAGAHQLVRVGLAGSDPEYGEVAERFLCTSTSQQSREGLELLLERLPALRKRAFSIGRAPNPDRQTAAALLPRIDAAAKAMDLSRGDSDAATESLQYLMNAVLKAAPSPDAVAMAMRWQDLGYSVAGAMRDYDIDLPPSMLPALVAHAAAEAGIYAKLIAHTGSVDAVPWLVEFGRSFKWNDWASDVLIELGRRCHDAPVRVAMREALAAHDRPVSVDAPLTLALLSMGDPEDLVVCRDHLNQSVVHPYAKRSGAEQRISPLGYLLSPEPDPPHGYSEAQIVEFLRATFSGTGAGKWPASPRELPAIPDRYLAEIARLVFTGYTDGYGTLTWQQRALLRFCEHPDSAPLREWFEEMLGKDRYTGANGADLLGRLPKELVATYRTRIEGLIDGDNANWAIAAIDCLTSAGIELDNAHLLHNRHAGVRLLVLEDVRRLAKVPVADVIAMLRDRDGRIRTLAAKDLGGMVAKDAVPALLELLRDPDDGVRQAAADALTRIRFYHDQQAHWDRVLKGLDASAASATEKLLLQAKPGAPKPQRLLAIESLGVLGVPEALPFLIDWTQDADAELAAAARAAITKIHLEPRK